MKTELKIRKREIKPETFVPCTICGSRNFEFVCNCRTIRIAFLKTPVSICRDCGFVFVNPRWTAEQYDKVMDLWYPFKFMWDPPDDPSEEKRFIKWRKMDERISRYYPDGIGNVLDIGAGQGWCIEYLKRKYPAIKAFAIERWESCQRHIESQYGAVVVGSEILGEWNLEYEGSFELIVFRHTLEHIIDPLKALEKVRRFLADDGYAYIVVPTMRETTRPLNHSYFRPCHLSYFCKETLESLAMQAGLSPVVLAEKGQKELWGLFKKDGKKFVKPDVYDEMKQIINRLRRKDFLKNQIELTKIKLLHCLEVAGIYKPPSG